jgi:NAD(P)-dependent dehydrogenase (short-subunit alcohol dehydrogenase family)
MKTNTPSTVRVILVAGGTGGLGRAVSLAFIEAGDRVVVTYQRQDEFDALKNLAGARSSKLEGQTTDVTDESAVNTLVAGIIARLGRLDAMVNTVGGFAGGTNLWETDGTILDQMFSLNVRSGFALAKAAVRVMLKQGSGAIVNVAAKAAIDPPAGLAAYSASKAAAVAMIGSLAAELKDTAIRVNSVLPSIIDTEPNRKAMPTADYSKWPKTEDIARAIVYLCSDSARAIRGTAITV